MEDEDEDTRWMDRIRRFHVFVCVCVCFVNGLHIGWGCASTHPSNHPTIQPSNYPSIHDLVQQARLEIDLPTVAAATVAVERLLLQPPIDESDPVLTLTTPLYFTVELLSTTR